jgi:hypothetical protein
MLRLRRWCDTHLPETQQGFRKHRGTRDALFIVTETLRQRRNANMESWMVCVDLVRAYETVSMDAMWIILAKAGFPPAYTGALERLTDGAGWHIRVGKDTATVWTTQGVRTGCTGGPDMFLAIMWAIHSGLKWPAPPAFRADKYLDGKQTTEFSVPNVEYADDSVAIAGNRDTAAEAAQLLVTRPHEIAGMEAHVAPTREAASKSQVLYVPARDGAPTDANVAPIQVKGPDGQPKWMPVTTTQVKYLGSIVASDLSPHPDIAARVAAAERVTKALRAAITDKRLRSANRGAILRATVLPTLLYGCETRVQPAAAHTTL